MSKTIYHVEVAKLGHGLSGGETAMLELIKYFSSKGYKNILITTDNGKTTYKTILNDDVSLRYYTIDSYKHEKRFGALISYIFRLKQVLPIIKIIKPKSDDVIICHSEFFPNSITNWMIHRRYKGLISGCLFHMKAPDLFKGYEGDFDGKFRLPNLRLLNYHFNQWLYKKLTKRNAIIFTVNDYYRDYLASKYPTNKIVVLSGFGGASPLKQTTMVTKKYDLIWIGRFHAQKGLNDLIKIISKVRSQHPSVNVVVLGGGNDSIKQQLLSQIKYYNLEKSVKLVGEVNGKEKYEYFNNSKIFAMTSHYESFGIVNLEAMSSGIPVVAYNLPVYSAFEEGLLKVPNGDIELFSSKIVSLLKNAKLYKQHSQASLREASRHSWINTGKQIEDALW